MSWKKILFVFNPVAGRSQIRTSLLDIIEVMSAADYEVICYPTKKAGDARKIVRERDEDFLYIACAGGDGTLDEVVSGMMENEYKPFVPIGYIPAGTTNDFASGLGIPTDMVKAAEVVANGKTFNCDLGEFNRVNYFTYVAAFGLFTATSYNTPQNLKNQLGHLAYILQGVQEVSHIQSYHMKVDADDMSISDEFVYGMITNAKSVGGFEGIAGRDVNFDDGLFEVTLIRMPANILELNEILQYLNHTIEETDLVYRFKTHKIILESQEEIKWTRDGEYGGAYRRVEIRNLHQRLKILVPGTEEDKRRRMLIARDRED